MANIYFKNGDKFTSILDIVYPVGSIYITTDTVSPAESVGGTWTQIKKRFILSSGETTDENYQSQDTGGIAEDTEYSLGNVSVPLYLPVAKMEDSAIRYPTLNGYLLNQVGGSSLNSGVTTTEYLGENIDFTKVGNFTIKSPTSNLQSSYVTTGNVGEYKPLMSYWSNGTAFPAFVKTDASTTVPITGKMTYPKYYCVNVYRRSA